MCLMGLIKLKSSLFVVFCVWVFTGIVNAQDLTQQKVQEPNGVVRYSEPIMSANKGLGEIAVLNPTVIADGDRLAMLYRVDANGAKGSRIQLAFSDDGRTFAPYASNPVLGLDSPDDKYGCEDPRVVQFSGTYYLTYVGKSGKDHFGQCLATSTDLIHWEKKGVVLDPAAQSWCRQQVKAAVIVPEKIGGKYIMYFIGQTQPWHASIGMAVSDDLLHWSQPLDHAIMAARPDHFDSMGVEPGPTPIMLPEGILLIYNGWNPAYVHKTGWVLFSKDNPSKILKRSDVPFIEPKFGYDVNSHHNVTFTEGAARFKGLWRFYYGAADTSIGLAEIDDIERLLKESP